MKQWIFHPGTPRAKGRPRLGGRAVYTPAATHHEEQRIGWAWRLKYPDDLPLACPVWLTIIAVGGTGDASNITKLVEDALNGVAYIDDRQVKRLSVRRLEAGVGCPVGTYIEVRPMTGPWRAQLARRIMRLTEER